VRAAALVLSLVSLPAALWALGLLPEMAALGFGLSVVVVALAQGGLGLYDLIRCRRLGDRLLRAYPGLPPVSDLAAWRSDELTSARNRRELARWAQDVGQETESCLRLRSPLVDRAVLEWTLQLAEQLEYRLELLSTPVTAIGMLDLEALVAAEVGPLSCPERAGALPAALARTLTALEPR
jgi:hypothetical protein